MLLLDDLLLAPVHGLLWVFGKIHEAAQEEIAGEAEVITEELRELYMMLETGKITEAEFDARERPLLDRLEATQERGSQPDEEDGGEDEEAPSEEGYDNDAEGEEQ